MLFAVIHVCLKKKKKKAIEIPTQYIKRQRYPTFDTPAKVQLQNRFL